MFCAEDCLTHSACEETFRQDFHAAEIKTDALLLWQEPLATKVRGGHLQH